MNNLINHYLFTNFDLSADIIPEISQRARLMTIGKRDLFKVNNLLEARVIMLLEGHAKLIEIDTEGNQEVKELFHSGEIFDTSTLITDQDCFLQSLSSNSKIAVIGELDFSDLISRNNKVLQEVNNLRKERIRKLHRRLNYLICRDVEQKMLIFLQELAMNNGRIKGERIVVENYLTHSDIAEIINMSRQTVTSLLNKMRSEGKIEYSRRELIFLDKELTGNLVAA